MMWIIMIGNRNYYHHDYSTPDYHAGDNKVRGGWGRPPDIAASSPTHLSRKTSSDSSSSSSDFRFLCMTVEEKCEISPHVE